MKAFVKDNMPEYIETKETVKWGELKKTLTAADGRFVTADGEIVDGVTYTEKRMCFTAKLMRGDFECLKRLNAKRRI